MQITGNRICDGSDEQCPIHIFINPDENEKRILIEERRIDEHTINSALDPNEPARIELESDHIALIIKRPKRYSPTDNFLFNVSSVGIFLFRDHLLILQTEDAPLFEGRQFLRVGSLVDVMLKLIYRSIFHFEEHLKVINMCSEDLEKSISTAMENKTLLNLFTLEKSLVYYLNAIGSNGRIIEKIRLNSAKAELTPENLALLDDIAIENSQCYEQAKIYSEVLSGLMDARVSVVSNNLNILMKALNIIMIALMVPTLWVSIFSMNLPIPYQDSNVMFLFVSVTAILLAIIIVFLWKLRKW
jgi:magnesium transporter